MRKNFEEHITRLEYSSTFTAFMVQSVICIAILSIIFCFKYFNEEILIRLGEILNNELDWQNLYDKLFKTKEILLNYLR